MNLNLLLEVQPFSVRQLVRMINAEIRSSPAVVAKFKPECAPKGHDQVRVVRAHAHGGRLYLNTFSGSHYADQFTAIWTAK